jgi:ribosomal protein S4
LDRFIARAGGIARLEARRVLERGGVWVDGKRVKIASRPLRPGQEVTVVLQEAGRPEASAVELGPERILFEDAYLVAVD